MLALGTGQADAKMPNIKISSVAAVNFELAPPDADPTAPDPTDPSGLAIIRIVEERKSTDYDLEVSLSGLPEGTYTVEGVLENEPEPQVLASVTVDASGDGEAEALVLDINPRSVITVNVIETSITGVETVVLTGTAELTTEQLKYFANVKVVAPPATTGVAPSKGKKVHGHALLKATVVDGALTKSTVLFVGQGAPKDTTLNILADGVLAGTVQSTKSGKVMFEELPVEFALEAIELLEIVDPATEFTVMEASF